MTERIAEIMRELESVNSKADVSAAGNKKDVIAQKFPEMFLTDQVICRKWISAKSKVRPKSGQACYLITLDGTEHFGFYCPELSNNGVGAFSIGEIVFWNNVLAWKVKESYE